MALNCVTLAALLPYLPADILSFGHPDNIDRIGQDLLSKCKLTSVDLFRHRGTEVQADLGQPLELGKFDIVLDVGTSEHVANIPTAFRNAAHHVKVGGIVLHHLPMTWVNHGYWNICPSWFKDFYTGNGFTIVRCDLTIDDERYIFDSHKTIPWPHGGPYGLVKLPPESMILFIAKKLNEQPIRGPYAEVKWGAGPQS